MRKKNFELLKTIIDDVNKMDDEIAIAYRNEQNDKIDDLKANFDSLLQMLCVIVEQVVEDEKDNIQE